MAAMGGRDDHTVKLRDPVTRRRSRVVLAAVPPDGQGETGTGPVLAADRSKDAAAVHGGGRRAPFVTVALAGLCLLVIDTAVGILPGDALAGDLPLLSVLTIQRVVVAACVLCLVIAAPRPSTFRTPVDLPLLALVALAAVALLQDGQSMAAWRGLVTAVAIFYIAVGVLRRHSDAAPVLLVAVLGSAFVAAAIGVQQSVDGVDTGFYRIGFQNADADVAGAVTRSIGTFTNPNLLAGFLVLALPMTVGLLGRRAGRRLQVAWVVLAGIVAAGLVVTFSRGAIAALAVVVVIGLAVRAASRRGRPVALLVLATAAVGITVTVALAAASGVLGRVTGRDDLWAAAVAATGTGGLSGVGYGRAGDVMSAVGDETFAHAHNLWLNWLVETGPLGPVLMSLVLLIGLVAGVRRALSGSVLAGGAVAGLAAIIFASVLDHPTTVSSILTLTMVALACTVAAPLPQPGVRGRHVRGHGHPGRDPGREDRLDHPRDHSPDGDHDTDAAFAPTRLPPRGEPARTAAPPPAARTDTGVPEGYPPVPRPVSVPRRLTHDGEQHGAPAVIRPADETAPVVPASRRPRRAMRPDHD